MADDFPDFHLFDMPFHDYDSYFKRIPMYACHIQYQYTSLSIYEINIQRLNS